MVDHVCMVPLARHVTVRSLKNTQIYPDYISVGFPFVLMQPVMTSYTSTAHRFFPPSLSHSPYRHLSRLPYEEWRALLCQNNSIDYRKRCSKNWFRLSSDFLPAASMSTTRDATSKVSKIPRSFPSDLDGVLCDM